MTKTKTFSIPQELVCDFTSIIEEHELDNRITETDGESITVEICYEKEDRQAIFEIMELLEEDED